MGRPALRSPAVLIRAPRAPQLTSRLLIRAPRARLGIPHSAFPVHELCSGRSAIISNETEPPRLNARASHRNESGADSGSLVALASGHCHARDQASNVAGAQT